MKHFCAVTLCVFFGGILFFAETSAAQGIILNEDDSHFYFSRKSDEMTREGLLAWVNQYEHTGVTHLFLCPNAMKASFRSKTWDSIWDLGQQRVPEGDALGANFVANARLLFERGLDPYAVWIEQARKINISPWVSMRMNDVHNVDDPKHYLHSSFWVNHPEFWRVPGSTSGSWVDRALDYTHPEVREYAMSFVKELLERYDVDGIELDWMRFGYHFKPGSESAGLALLNDFMKTVRETADTWSKKRNHPIKISARVPAVPDASLGLGLDAITWVNEKWVDILVPTPFWATADYNIPFDVWREKLGDAQKNVTLAAGLELLLRAYPGAKAKPTDLAAVYGFATAAYHRGADQIYLFNYFDPTPIADNPAESKVLLEKGLARKIVEQGPRRHIITYHDTVTPTVSADIQLPADITQTPKAFKIYAGPLPHSGSAAVIIGLSDKATTTPAEVILTVNKHEQEIAGKDNSIAVPGTSKTCRFSIPLDTLTDGWNEFHLKTTASGLSCSVVWMELDLNP